MDEAYLTVLGEYRMMFGSMGSFEFEKHPEIKADDLRRCIHEQKTVYELGMIDGDDPAFITKDGEKGWA